MGSAAGTVSIDGEEKNILDEFEGINEFDQNELKEGYQSLLNEGVEGPEAIKKLREIYESWKDNIKVIELTGLLEATDQAIKDGKTPLVLDRSADHKVDTFFSYRSAIILDAKKLGLDKGMRQIPVESLMKEIRQKLVGALKNGYPLIISMQQSACDFANTFNDEAEAAVQELDDLKEGNKYFPKEVFHKGGKDLVKDEFLDKIFRDEDKEGNVAFSRNPDTFQVVVTSYFNRLTYEEYLFGESHGLPQPKDMYQVIYIKNNEDTELIT